MGRVKPVHGFVKTIYNILYSKCRGDLNCLAKNIKKYIKFY